MAKVTASHTCAGLSSSSILVVDDQKANLDLLVDLLNENGYTVRATANSEFALRSVASSPPDLILLDIKMPKMNGYEVCERLKASKGTRDIPVIFISALGETEDKIKAFEVGGVDYITKPFQAKEVLARVNTHLTLWQMQNKLTGMVTERTAELLEKNKLLEEEIQERHKVENEKLKMEKVLFQSQKLEALGTLAGGIAHDFNNILGTIMSNTETAITFEIPKDHPAQESLVLILDGAKRAADLVRQVRIFNKQPATDYFPFDPLPTIKEVIQFLKSSLPATIEIKPIFAVKSSSILADPTDIHRILMNLSTNAVHAMADKGGVLTIQVDNLYLDREISVYHNNLPPGAYLQIIVGDTGHGIPTEIQGLIFDPYFTTKPFEKGTGLGLAVVHGIVKSLQGAIRIESNDGAGCTFSILLPQIVIDQELANDTV